MTLTLADLDFLASAPGERLLAELAADDLSDAHTLALLNRLRRDHPAEHARAALELARLRLRAVDKFGPDARRMFFTREALEQASHPLARRYRATIAPGQTVVDAGCGIGADSLAFAAAGRRVLGLDNDPLRVALARLNARTLRLDARFELGDITAGLPAADLVFFDPTRRDDTGRRLFAVEQYQPPLSTVRKWPHQHILVKLSPGVTLDQLATYSGGVEFVSADGDLKEALLWLGTDLSGARATLLVGDQALHWTQPAFRVEPVIAAPRGWLVEPDPALLRAGLVAEAAAAFNGAQLDPTIAYFTTDSRPVSPWLRAWQIFDWLPFNLKRLRAALRQRGIGAVTVKKRGVAITPESLRAQLKLRGDAACTLVLTRHNGQPIVLICADIAAQ